MAAATRSGLSKTAPFAAPSPPPSLIRTSPGSRRKLYRSLAETERRHLFSRGAAIPIPAVPPTGCPGSPALEQRIHVRVPPTERPVRLGAVGFVAGGEQGLAEAVGGRLIPGAARFLERRPGVGVHHFRPEVGIIAGRV